MSIRTKAASLGVAALMVASLAGTALGASTVSNTATPTGPVVRDGGYVGTASYTFTEAAVNQFPAGGFVLTIDISDAQGGRTVHFDKTASSIVLSPDSLALSATFSASNDYTLIVTSLTSNVTQLETLGISGLKVKADDEAALGAIRTRYSLNDATFDLGGKSTTTSTGRVSGAGGAAADGSTFDIALDAGSPNFTADVDATGATDTDGNGPIAFSDGANSESVGTVVAGAVALGIQTITSTAARTYAHAQFTPVSQTHTLLNCQSALAPAEHVFGICALASIGTVVDSVASDADVTMVQRGLANTQAMGTIYLWERTTGAAGNGSSAGYIATGATITLTLDAALGVKFSVPPTASVGWWAAAVGGTMAVLAPGANPVVRTLTSGADQDFGLTTATYDDPNTVAVEAIPVVCRSNLAANDSPALFENSAVTAAALPNLTTTPALALGHAAGTAIGQDVYNLFPFTSQATTDATTAAQAANAACGLAVVDSGAADYDWSTAAPTGRAPLVLANGGVADLSADRLTATFTVASADVGAILSEIHIDGFYDASAASAAYSAVTVGIAISGDNVVTPSVVNAVLNNTADGTADAPTVIIGENDQQSGTVTIREAGAAALGSSAATNVLRICYEDHDTLGTGFEIFTRAPWAVVTAGDLKLRAISDPTLPSGPATPGTGVRGDLSYMTPAMGSGHCAQWIVYTASTVASTIEIRGSAADGTMLGAGAAHGPQINVPAQMTPGPSTLSLLYAASIAASGTQFDLVVNAIRVYGGSPVVAAVSNPEIYRGKISQAAGDVTITETQTWQLGQPGTTSGQRIMFSIVPNNLRDTLPSVYFDTNRNLPVVSTNGAVTGLVAHFYGFQNNTQFIIQIDQRAYVPITGAWVPGVITVSNIKYNTTTDAAWGNVELQVCSPLGKASEIAPWACGAGIIQGAENPANISDVVTNAHVVNTGLFPSLQIAAGYKTRETSPYQTYGTLVVSKGSYVTVKVRIGTQFAGKRIEFWQKNGKTGTWVRKTIGRVDAAGYAYWSTRPPKLSGTGYARYVYYRAYFAGTSEVAAAWSQTVGRVVVK